MTSSTPSPSAQELAAYLIEAAKVLRDESLDGVAMPETAEILDLSATLIRRLSDTERERDEAVEGEKAAMALCRLQQDIAKAAEAERDRLREMLAQAAKWFRDYETGHLAKGALDKAQRNRERAEACEALSKKENPT